MSTDWEMLDRPETWARRDQSAERITSAEDQVAVLYASHALGLIRLAHVMLGDKASAEDVVQDAFFGLYRSWARLSDPAMALPYLRASVLNGCKSLLRWRQVRTSRALHEERHDTRVFVTCARPVVALLDQIQISRRAQFYHQNAAGIARISQLAGELGA